MPNRTTVIVVNWNGRKHLQECYDALLAQTIKDFSIIVVDNGSTDDSVAYTKHHLPQANVIELRENTGFAKANNIGIQKALENSLCDYIVLLNNDTAIEPNWMNSLIMTADQHPEYSSIACLMVYYNDPQCVDSAGHHLLPTGRVTNWGAGMDRKDFSIPGIVFGACAGAGLYRRSFFEQIGFFDESLFAYYEDVDLNWRAVLQGLKCYYQPQAVVRHKGAGTSQRNRRFQILSFRNRLIVNTKNLPTDFIFAHFFRWLGFESYMIGILLINGKIAALLAWLKQFPLRRRERRTNMKRRTITLPELLSYEAVQPKT